MVKITKSPFKEFLESVNKNRIYFEPLAGNNGDSLIVLGAKKLLKETSSFLVDSPCDADYILLNGGGAMTDFWGGGIQKIEYYRTQYPDKPIIVGPSSFYIEKPYLKNICELCHTNITIFLRETLSEKHLRSLNLPSYVSLHLSPDLAFELANDPMVFRLRNQCKQKHVLIAMRKDKEGKGGVLSKTKGNWLPKNLRRHLSKVRDVLVSWQSHSEIHAVLMEDIRAQKFPKIRRDVSVSVSFEEFLDQITNAALIITDRLHVAILGYMLEKPVYLISGNYHKIEGVFNYSMNHPGSTVSLLTR